MNLSQVAALKSIRLYQKISGILPKPTSGGCRYYPSCSEYSYQAIAKYGTIVGLFLGLKRILRCNPLWKGGNDPVK